MIQARLFETEQGNIWPLTKLFCLFSVSFHFQVDPRNSEYTCSPSKTFVLAMTREDRIHVYLTIFKHLKSSECLTLVSLSTRALSTLLRNPTNVHISKTWRNSRKKQHENSWIKFYCLPDARKVSAFRQICSSGSKVCLNNYVENLM